MNPQEIVDDLLFKHELPAEDTLLELLDRAAKIFSLEPTLLELQLPLSIIGDLHGQFYDMLEQFKLTGLPPFTNFLFLGDLVDRGMESLHVSILVFAYKVLYPERLNLIRGNHEAESANKQYGFYTECLRTYGINVFKQFETVFNVIPLAALVEKRIFAVHAGLSPLCDTLTEINQLQRPNTLQDESPASDLLWSDPDVSPGYGRSQRGAGFTFGEDVTESFLKNNQLKLIVRGHQMVDGYEYFHDREVVTVFSAPNYCYRCENKGAIMEIEENLSIEFALFGWEGEKGASGVETRAIDYFI